MIRLRKTLLLCIPFLCGCVPDDSITKVSRASFHAGIDLGYQAATNGISCAEAHEVLDKAFDLYITK